MQATPVRPLTKLDQAVRIAKANPWYVALIGGAEQREGKLIQAHRVGQVDELAVKVSSVPDQPGLPFAALVTATRQAAIPTSGISHCIAT